MNRAALVIALAASLAACGAEPDIDVRNASVEDVANEVADAGLSERIRFLGAREDVPRLMRARGSAA